MKNLSKKLYEIDDDRLPEYFQGRTITNIVIVRPFMAGGYLLTIDDDEKIRIGGNGNINYPFTSIYVKEIE
jgi:hypothetical protein